MPRTDSLPLVQIDAQMQYDASPDRVMAVLADPAFQDEKCRETGAIEYEVDIETPGARTVITTTRTMPVDSLPDFVRSFLGGKLVVREIQDWGPAAADGGRDADLSVEIVGTPMRLRGTLEMVGDEASTTVTIDSELKANIPFIGGKAEQAAAGPIRAAVGIEERLGREWLAR
jgi:hypothetical protein